MKSFLLGPAAFLLAVSLPSQAAPLTSLQKQLAMSTFQSQSLALAVARSVDLNKTPATPTNDAAGAAFAKMLGSLQSGIGSGNCVVTNDTGRNETIANGANATCPVTFNDNLNGLFHIISYSVGDGAYYALNDVVGNSLSVRGATVGSAITFSGSGTIQSQTLGNLPVTVSGAGTYDSTWSGTLDVHYMVQFAAFKADLELIETIAESGGTIAYKLNDVPLTAAEVDFVKLPALQPQSKTASTGAGMMIEASSNLFR